MQDKVAFAQLFTDWVPALTDPAESKVVGDWNFALIPRQVKNVQQSGMVGEAINSDMSTERKNASFLFLKWLTGKKLTMKLTAAQNLGPSRMSVIDALENDPELFYLKTIKESLKTARVYGMKIPEFFELNDVLTTKVSQCLAGSFTPEEALDQAQADWVRIMKKAGYF